MRRHYLIAVHFIEDGMGKFYKKFKSKYDTLLLKQCSPANEGATC